MDINIAINDPALEARLTDYYDKGKIGEETFDVFCGRIVLSQMIGQELNASIQAQETALKTTLQQSQQTLAQEGEKTIRGWTESAMKEVSKLKAVRK